MNQTIQDKLDVARQELESEIEAEELHEKIEALVNGKIRIVDDLDHLLCIYNPDTRSIEIQVPVGRSADRGKKFKIGLDEIMRAGTGNPFTSEPVFIFKAEKISDGRG